jgi:putative peptidoglycan lipid II flippase
MSLVKSSIGVSIISLFISIVSFINQIIIANYFGAGKSLDIYLLASSVPLMISGLVSSALSFSLIP